LAVFPEPARAALWQWLDDRTTVGEHRQLSPTATVAHLEATLGAIQRGAYEQFVPLMHELKLEQAVVFRGFIPHSELPKHLGRYQVYVNSSISEGQCLAVYEAAMAGLAVCLPRTISFTGTFKDRALFHEIGDTPALAHSMYVYATDSAMRDRHIESAQKYIREQYNRTVVNERVKKLFSFDIV
jgi:glycosyltransferase involved in cell wall biosynthesis